MWLWISIGLMGYLAIAGFVLMVGASARIGDRSEQAVFASWVDEHPAPRGGRPKAA